jgi:cell filamentation protein
VEIANGGHQLQFRCYISTGMADVHRRLEQSDRLRNLNPAAFAKMAGEIMGDLNYVYPFRDGNGRTQLIYLEQLAAQASHPLEIGQIDPARWIIGSQAAHHGNYEPMANEIERAIRGPRPRA